MPLPPSCPWLRAPVLSLLGLEPASRSRPREVVRIGVPCAVAVITEPGAGGDVPIPSARAEHAERAWIANAGIARCITAERARSPAWGCSPSAGPRKMPGALKREKLTWSAVSRLGKPSLRGWKLDRHGANA